MIVDKQTVSNDIPSILYGSLVPKESPLYRALQEEREVVKANYDSGLLSESIYSNISQLLLCPCLALFFFIEVGC